MNTRRATVSETVVARDQVAARRGAERLVDRPTAGLLPGQEAILAQRDESLRALAATVAAIRLREASPERWATPVLTRWGLDPQPGADPAAIAAGGSGLIRAAGSGEDQSGAGRKARFPADTRAPREARRFIEAVLSEWRLPAPVVADVETVVTELVTNAVRHARFTGEDAEVALIVKLSAGRNLLTVEVHDPDAAKLPVWKAPPTSSAVQDPTTHSGEAGAGLRIVAALADRYGYAVTHDGKAVWAEISTLPVWSEPA